MKKTIFFDLGNVLLFFSHERMMQQVADFCQLELPIVKNAVEKLGIPYELGTVGSKEIHQEFSDLVKKKIEFKGLMHALSNIFHLNLPVAAIVKELKSKNVPLFVLSNTCEAHFTYAYKHYSPLHLFDGYVLSYEVGARKPEQKIFEHAISKAGCSPESCFYTDDIAEYIYAARSLHIDAETYTTPEKLTQQLTARGLL